MKKFLRALLCTALLCTLLLTTAHADTGPKPSVRVSFTGLGDRLCYATLLSEDDRTGPASVWSGVPASAYHKGNYDYADLDEATWQAFQDYEDADGYYFLQWGWQVSDAEELAWTYYSPDRFKVLLYFPDDGTFICSNIWDRYAFHSTFDAAVDVGAQTIHVEKNYSYAAEILPLLARMAITLTIELLLALAFGFRKKQHFRPIAAVNIVTQLGLNAALFYAGYRHGLIVLALWYVNLELAIIVVEAVALCLLLRRREPPMSPARIILYSLVANVLSFGAGLALSVYLPELF